MLIVIHKSFIIKNWNHHHNKSQEKPYIWKLKSKNHILACQIRLGIYYFDIWEKIGGAKFPDVPLT